jgi:hypothetical protein
MRAGCLFQIKQLPALLGGMNLSSDWAYSMRLVREERKKSKPDPMNFRTFDPGNQGQSESPIIRVPFES